MFGISYRKDKVKYIKFLTERNIRIYKEMTGTFGVKKVPMKELVKKYDISRQRLHAIKNTVLKKWLAGKIEL